MYALLQRAKRQEGWVRGRGRGRYVHLHQHHYENVLKCEISNSYCLWFSVCSNDGIFDVALHVHVQVYYNGRVTWTPPALYCSSCGVQVNINTYTHTNLKYRQALNPPNLLPSSSSLTLVTSLLFHRLGNIFPVWLAELHHAVPLLHVWRDGDRHTVRSGLERQRDQGDPTGRRLQWWECGGMDGAVWWLLGRKERVFYDTEHQILNECKMKILYCMILVTFPQWIAF